MSDQILNYIADDLHGKIDSFQPRYTVREIGTVAEAGDGIAQVRA